jgi:hypothetical protein
VLTLAAAEIGYVVVAATKGFTSASTTVTFWPIAAICFGAPVGLAAYSLRAGDAPWGAVGGGLVAGIVSGEGLASYLTVRDTTNAGYWIAQMIVGLVILTLVGRRTGYVWALAAFAVGVGVLLATRSVPVFGS